MRAPSEHHARIEVYAASNAVAVRKYVFLMPWMQQVETGQRELQLVVHPPAQSRVEFGVGGHVRIRQRADRAQVGVQEPVFREIHRGTDETAVVGIVSGHRGAKQPRRTRLVAEIL